MNLLFAISEAFTGLLAFYSLHLCHSDRLTLFGLENAMKPQIKSHENQINFSSVICHSDGL